MPSHEPRNDATRKREILNYKIFEFLKGIEKENSREILADRAEKVRIAQLNFLKARLALLKKYKYTDESEETIRL